jgi:peptidoglycan-associated lipoprotein
MSKIHLAVALLGALLITGCSQKTKPDESAGEVVEPQAQEEQGLTTQPVPGEGEFSEGAGAAGSGGMFGGTPGEAGSRTIIYFDFDSDAIRAEYSEMLAAHANYLASNAGAAVRLEGHADERGSREYNIGLGERRAQAVRRALLLQGDGSDRDIYVLASGTMSIQRAISETDAVKFPSFFMGGGVGILRAFSSDSM